MFCTTFAVHTHTYTSEEEGREEEEEEEEVCVRLLPRSFLLRKFPVVHLLALEGEIKKKENAQTMFE